MAIGGSLLKLIQKKSEHCKEENYLQFHLALLKIETWTSWSMSLHTVSVKFVCICLSHYALPITHYLLIYPLPITH